MEAATATKEHLFTSRFGSHRLVWEPGDQEVNYRGTVIRTLKPVDVEFENYELRVTERDGKAIANGREVRERSFDQVIEWLRSHPKFNVEFWERGNAPDEPRPTIRERQREIARAVSRADIEGLRVIRRAEEGTHNRDVVLNSVDESLEALEEAAAAPSPEALGPDPEAPPAGEPDEVTGDGESSIR